MIYSRDGVLLSKSVTTRRYQFIPRVPVQGLHFIGRSAYTRATAFAYAGRTHAASPFLLFSSSFRCLLSWYACCGCCCCGLLARLRGSRASLKSPRNSFGLDALRNYYRRKLLADRSPAGAPRVGRRRRYRGITAIPTPGRYKSAFLLAVFSDCSGRINVL